MIPLAYFNYGHLPECLQNTVRPFAQLAEQLLTTLPQTPERTACLRKLLESKDCAVRAKLYPPSYFQPSFNDEMTALGLTRTEINHD